MDQLPDVFEGKGPEQSLTVLRQSMPSLTKSNAESKRRAKTIAETILRRYPDYGKAPPHYLMALVEVIELYPENVQNAFADMATGISARTKFLPTVHDFVLMAGEIFTADDKRSSEKARIDDLAERVRQRRLTSDAPIGREPVRFYAPNGEQISEREAFERAKRHEANKAHEAALLRRRAYTTEIGRGDPEAGELLMLERGLADVPAEWNPTTPHRSAA